MAEHLIHDTHALNGTPKAAPQTTNRPVTTALTNVPAIVPQPAPLIALHSLADALAADADARRAALVTGRAVGPVTGYEQLDKMLCGYLAPGVHVLHGAPGVGKTAFALSIAVQCGCPAVFVTCEIRPMELMRRLIARTTNTYLDRLKSGVMTGDTVRDLVAKTAAAAPMLGILDATDAIAPPDHLVAMLELVKNAPGAEGALGALMVIDSGHTWAGKTYSGMDEYERLGRALDDLEKVAHAAGAAVIVTAERNRASTKTGGQSASAGSRRWEYAGESVIELDRDEKQSAGDRAVSVTVSKNRHGDTGIVKLLFDGRVQKHREV